MSFAADVYLDGKVLVEKATITEALGQNGQLMYWLVNSKDTDSDVVDEINFILPATGNFFFRLWGARQ